MPIKSTMKTPGPWNSKCAARVASREAVRGRATAGLMVRTGLDRAAPHAYVGVQADLMSCRWRLEQDGSTEETSVSGVEQNPPKWLRIARSGWEALPEPVARRVARLALRRAGAARDVSRVHLERVVNALRCGRPGSCIELPGGLELTCEDDAFRLRRTPEAGKGAC